MSKSISEKYFSVKSFVLPPLLAWDPKIDFGFTYTNVIYIIIMNTNIMTKSNS